MCTLSASILTPCLLAYFDSHSSYTFSPLSGLIHVHTIDSILPAPHQAVFDGLRASLGNVFGSPKQPGDAGAACKEQTDD